MPELPEVEIVRRGLEPVLVGRRFESVEQRRPDLRFPLPKDFPGRLRGQKVERLERRAKYILAYLSGGDVLLMHLGMTGSFSVHAGASRVHARESAVHERAYTGRNVKDLPRGIGDNSGANNTAGKHDHIVFHVERDGAITYNDPRRFGFMLLIPGAELSEHPLMRALGVEPLSRELTPEYLARRARGKKVALKPFLADQRIVAGVGNIYACEALFRARLSPLRAAASLATKTGKPTPRAHALVPALRGVLEDAIAAGGSTLRDYRKADGTLGEFQHRFDVYDREGKPCRRKGCGGTVKRIVQAGRSTFYCPRCQR